MTKAKSKNKKTLPEPEVVVSVEKGEVTGLAIEVGSKSVSIKDFEALARLWATIDRTLKDHPEGKPYYGD